jgi:hypothetical protein
MHVATTHITDLLRRRPPGRAGGHPLRAALSPSGSTGRRFFYPRETNQGEPQRREERKGRQRKKEKENNLFFAIFASFAPLRFSWFRILRAFVVSSLAVCG